MPAAGLVAGIAGLVTTIIAALSNTGMSVHQSVVGNANKAAIEHTSVQVQQNLDTAQQALDASLTAMEKVSSNEKSF